MRSQAWRTSGTITWHCGLRQGTVRTQIYATGSCPTCLDLSATPNMLSCSATALTFLRSMGGYHAAVPVSAERAMIRFPQLATSSARATPKRCGKTSVQSSTRWCYRVVLNSMRIATQTRGLPEEWPHLQKRCREPCQRLCPPCSALIWLAASAIVLGETLKLARLIKQTAPHSHAGPESSEPQPRQRRWLRDRL